jgi:exopolysaccharide biosynthesis polyprenyl glycosylphosphotransferase
VSLLWYGHVPQAALCSRSAKSACSRSMDSHLIDWEVLAGHALVNSLSYHNVKGVFQKGIRSVGAGEVNPSERNNNQKECAHPLTQTAPKYPRIPERLVGASGNTTPDRRSRPRPKLSFSEKPEVSMSPNGALLPRPDLLASPAAWTALDFAGAFCCGIIAIVTNVVPLKSLLASRLLRSGASHAHFVLVVGMVLFAAGVATLSRLFGLQPFRNNRTIPSELLLIVLAVSLASFARDGMLRFWALPAPTSEMLQLALTCGALFLCRVIWRRHWDNHDLRNTAAKNILIAGNDPVGRDVRRYLESLRYAGFRFKGFVALNEDPKDDNDVDEKETVGNINDVIALARSLFVDEIIFSHRPTTPNVLSSVLSQARSVGIDIRLIPNICEKLKRRRDVDYLGELPTIVLNYREKRAMSHLVKRTMDVVFGSGALVVMCPLFLLVALLIKLQSSGPVFYRSKRVGYKGMVFNCYKFRTMMQDAESMRDQYAHLNERHDILFKIAKDPRVTRIGAILRKYSVDELPQLWNVLCGEMSLVGPRPSIRSEVAQYKTAHLRRLDMVPGMTGLWQVEARLDPSFESYINLDSKYVREWSIWLDLKIILRTASVVLKGTGT